MATYLLHIPPEEVIRLVRAEIDAAAGQPELYESASQDYLIEEDYDRRAYGLFEGSEYDLVTAEAVLNIEPRLEQNYWVLSVVVHNDLGPQLIDDENALLGAELSLDEFEARFAARGAGRVSVRLEAQTPGGKKHFDRWWAELSARHPSERRAIPAERAEAPFRSTTEHTTEQRSPVMKNDLSLGGSWTYRAREAVGVFADADALEEAVNELEVSGFDKASISVLGADDEVKARIGRLYRTVSEIEDEGRAPEVAFEPKSGRVEEETAAVAFPFYIGGLAGAAAVVASGGALAAAIAATILGGAAGAGLGAILAYAVARRHARRIEDQLAKGGLVLWVSVPDEEAEKRALGILEMSGARDIHVHEIEREWGPKDRPLAEAQLDPFLDRDAPQ